MYNITHNFNGNAVIATPKTLPEIDEVYIFKTNFDSELRQKVQPEYKYMNHGIPETAKEGEIFTYMETVNIDGLNRGITLVTREHRKSYIKKFFTQVKKELNADKNKQFRTATLRPQRIGLTYFS